jgi:hypothetical protein
MKKKSRYTAQETIGLNMQQAGRLGPGSYRHEILELIRAKDVVSSRNSTRKGAHSVILRLCYQLHRLYAEEDKRKTITNDVLDGT